MTMNRADVESKYRVVTDLEWLALEWTVATETELDTAEIVQDFFDDPEWFVTDYKWWQEQLSKTSS